MLAAILGFILWLMIVAPNVPIVRALHRHLVVLPLEMSARFDRRHVLFVFAVLAMASMGLEMIALLGSADLAVLAAWDMSVAIDVAIAVWTLASVNRVRAGWNAVRSRVAGGAALMRGRTRNRVRRDPAARRRVAANDDADGDGAALACAV